MQAGKKSYVWEHFDLDSDRKRTKCRLCGIMLSYSGSTTSTMKKHLQIKHPSLNSAQASTSSSAVRPITDLFQRPLSRDKYERITQKAVLMCAQDLQPLSVVDGKGFRAFCSELNPSYKVPSHTTIHNYLMKMFAESKASLTEIFETHTAGVAMTTDLWTSVATHGYITVTAHYISTEWQLMSVMLATRRVEERHTGENVASILNDIQTEFKVKKVSALTTDNVSNMQVAARATPG